MVLHFYLKKYFSYTGKNYVSIFLSRTNTDLVLGLIIKSIVDLFLILNVLQRNLTEQKKENL
jgi:hypothetical protein